MKFLLNLEYLITYIFVPIRKFSSKTVSDKNFKSLAKWDSDSKKLYGPKKNPTKTNLNISIFSTNMNETSEYEYIENYEIDKVNMLEKNKKLTEIKTFSSKERNNIYLQKNNFESSSLYKKYDSLLKASLYYETKENFLFLPKFSHPPSVTNILQETIPEPSKQNLKRWEEEMILKHGQKGFNKIKQDTFENGLNLHSNIQYYILNGSLYNLKKENEGHWSSVKPVLNHLENVVNTELEIQHKILFYKGVIDCVAIYEDKLYLIDWKTSKRKKSFLSQTFDNPIQLVAYQGAYNQSCPRNQITNCMLVITYEDGSPADLLKMNSIICLKYWELWLQRLKEFCILHE